jgi:hypothetical protein
LSDISVLGQHIAQGYLAEIEPKKFRTTAEAVMDKARKAIGDIYHMRREEDGATVELTRTVWSFTYVCPACRKQMTYFDHLSPSGAPPKSCPSCEGEFVRRKWARGEDVPVEVVAEGVTGKLTSQPISELDLQLIEHAKADQRLDQVPSLEITSDREMYSRSGLGKSGLLATSGFFSPRNALALLELWNAIAAVEDAGIRRKLQFAFTAILPRASRRYQWSAQRPLNAQNQTYYIAPVYYEWNVFELFNRKVEAAIRADEELALTSDARAGAAYDLASADGLKHLQDASVDYVFTDPPFGSNIFYSDMSLFHEAWLGRSTDNEREAVVHTTGKRKQGAEDRYERLLRDAFREAYRILKPGRYMSVVFGNSSGRIWGLVQRSLRDAGFKAAPAHVAILDKGQRSVKGLNSGSEGVVTVDLIMTVQKPEVSDEAEDAHAPAEGDVAALIQEAIADLSIERAKNPSYVYAHILTKAIRHHLTLDGLHLGDVLVALRRAGYSIDRKTGLLQKDDLLNAA